MVRRSLPDEFALPTNDLVYQRDEAAATECLHACGPTVQGVSSTREHSAQRIFWYDGGLYPPRDVGEIAEGQQYPDNGSIVVGDKGKLSFYNYQPKLIPEAKMKDYQKPPAEIPRCESDHFGEWVTACKGGRAAFSNFDHAGPLTEMVLLGNLALRAGTGQRVEWDAANTKVANRPELNQYVSRVYRKGWEL